MSRWLPELLAKSAKFNGGHAELLEEHTENVVAALAGLAHRFSGLAEVLRRDDFWHLAFWTCVIHDFGKAASGFQKVLREEAAMFGHRHEVLSVAFVPWVADALESEPITLGVISHHRDALVIGERYDGVDLNELTQQISAETAAALATWLEQVPNTWVAKYDLARFGVRQKQLTVEPFVYAEHASKNVYSGLSHYLQFHKRCRDGYLADVEVPQEEIMFVMALRGAVTQADRLASAHAPITKALTLPTLSQLTAHLSQNLKREVVARDHQVKAQRAGNLVMLAPTGSGKTEAALGWAATQQKDGGAQRLVYVLPYQASLNAMRQRLEKNLAPPGGVSLLHSRSLQVLYEDLASKSEDSAKSLTVQARRQNDFNKLHQPAVAVSTPYHLLRGAYRLPGYEALFTMLSGAALIWDEVHAYEPRRLGLFFGLVQFLTETWRVKVCAMTATMPGWLQKELETLLGTSTLVPDNAIFDAAQRHRLELLDGELTDSAVLNKICSEVQCDRSVLVASNTIGRAQKAYTKLASVLGKEQVILLHSRFTGDDRLRIETDLQRRLAAGSKSKPVAVVATQVIEVSLDLDFDRIYTEPAPLEALIQRFGRVNRLGLKGVWGLVPVTVLTKPRTGQRIYDDRLVERGLVQLESAVEADDTVVDDRRVREWLDAVYDAELVVEWQQQIRNAKEDFEDSALNNLYPFESSLDLKQAFYALFEGGQVLPKCMLDTYRLRLETAPVTARGLLVTVPDWVFAKTEVVWDDELKLHVADLSYSSELGLEL